MLINVGYKVHVDEEHLSYWQMANVSFVYLSVNKSEAFHHAQSKNHTVETFFLAVVAQPCLFWRNNRLFKGNCRLYNCWQCTGQTRLSYLQEGYAVCDFCVIKQEQICELLLKVADEMNRAWPHDCCNMRMVAVVQDNATPCANTNVKQRIKSQKRKPLGVCVAF